MDGQLRQIIRQKILDAEAALIPVFTRRDIHVPGIPNKAITVIGMRRSSDGRTANRSWFKSRRTWTMPATRDREVQALLAAAEEHPRASLAVVTLTPESARDVPEGIQVHDAAFWFLEPWMSDLGTGGARGPVVGTGEP